MIYTVPWAPVIALSTVLVLFLVVPLVAFAALATLLLVLLLVLAGALVAAAIAVPALALAAARRYLPHPSMPRLRHRLRAVRRTEVPGRAPLEQLR